MSKNNGEMMQDFHWYTPADGNLWKQLAENAKTLAEAGITAVWLPLAQTITKKNGFGYYYSFDHTKCNSNNAGNRCGSH